MSNYVRVEVKCPCGRVLKTGTYNTESTSTTRGTLFCINCRKKVEFEIKGASVRTHYKK